MTKGLFAADSKRLLADRQLGGLTSPRAVRRTGDGGAGQPSPFPVPPPVHGPPNGNGRCGADKATLRGPPCSGHRVGSVDSGRAKAPSSTGPPGTTGTCQNRLKIRGRAAALPDLPLFLWPCRRAGAPLLRRTGRSLGGQHRVRRTLGRARENRENLALLLVIALHDGLGHLAQRAAAVLTAAHLKRAHGPNQIVLPNPVGRRGAGEVEEWPSHVTA